MHAPIIHVLQLTSGVLIVPAVAMQCLSGTKCCQLAPLGRSQLAATRHVRQTTGMVHRVRSGLLSSTSMQSQGSRRALRVAAAAAQGDKADQDPELDWLEMEERQDMEKLKKTLAHLIEDGNNPLVVELVLQVALLGAQFINAFYRRKCDEVALVQKPRSFGMGHKSLLLYKQAFAYNSDAKSTAFVVVERSELKALKDFVSLKAFAMAELQVDASDANKCILWWSPHDEPPAGGPRGLINDSRYAQTMDKAGCLCLQMTQY